MYLLIYSLRRRVWMCFSRPH